MQKILIVDDMTVSLMMVENMLSTRYETVCAESGEEALELFRKERPDMVLSDLRMPGMSGFELMQKLQAIHLYHALLVLRNQILYLKEMHKEKIGLCVINGGLCFYLRSWL